MACARLERRKTVGELTNVVKYDQAPSQARQRTKTRKQKGARVAKYCGLSGGKGAHRAASMSSATRRPHGRGDAPKRANISLER